MKKEAVCEYCGKIFTNKEYEYDTYLSECAKHEVTHLNLEATFKENLDEALKQLDNKYNSKSNYNNLEVDVCYDEDYYGTDVTYSFKLHNDKIEKIYEIRIEVQYKDKEQIPSTEEIINKIEKYYIANIKKEYKGKVSFEDYCGGNGADDYIIGDRYVRDIFHELVGKNIEIKILD